MDRRGARGAGHDHARQPTGASCRGRRYAISSSALSFNQDQAVSYLADAAYLSGMGMEGSRELRSTLSWWQATGFKLMPTSCDETGKTSAIGTWVSCDFDFHSPRSDEIGKGPYSGSSFTLAVRDGEIVLASMDFEIGELSTQMWERSQYGCPQITRRTRRSCTTATAAIGSRRSLSGSGSSTLASM